MGKKLTSSASSRWVMLPFALLAIGIMAAVLLVLTQRLNEREYQASFLNEHVMGMQRAVLNSHLEFEEFATGEGISSMEESIERLIHAGNEVDILLDVGTGSEGLQVALIDDPDIRAKAREVGEMIDLLKGVIGARIDAEERLKPSDDIEEQIDELYQAILEESETLEHHFHEMLFTSHSHGQRIFWAILNIWIAVVIVGAVGFAYYERRRRSAEADKAKLIAELEEALANIETLTGLIPICAYCKKVKDDKGYWKQVEHYVAEHSKAEFSHGICEDCSKNLIDEARREGFMP